MTADVAATVARIQDVLRRRGETVAVTESLTGGLVSAALTEAAGSSGTFRGGIVVYSVDLKVSLAGVAAQLLVEHGPVHEAVAVELARGACRACGADWGLGTTGAAGPEGHGGRPGGTVCVAVARRDDIAGAGHAHATTTHCAGERAAVRSAAVRLVLDLLVAQLDEGEVSP